MSTVTCKSCSEAVKKINSPTMYIFKESVSFEENTDRIKHKYRDFVKSFIRRKLRAKGKHI
jgi:hypothetical protein